MKKLAFYFGLFAVAAALSAALPAIARADRVDSAHLQVRDPLGRKVGSSTGDSANISALLAFARDPQAYVPNQLAAKQPIDLSEILDQRKVAENSGKKLPVQSVRLYKDKKILVPDDGFVLVPMGTFHTETIQVEGAIDDAAM